MRARVDQPEHGKDRCGEQAKDEPQDASSLQTLHPQLEQPTCDGEQQHAHDDGGQHDDRSGQQAAVTDRRRYASDSGKTLGHGHLNVTLAKTTRVASSVHHVHARESIP